MGTAQAETVTQAVARRETTNSPAALVRQYERDFTTVLPSHIKPDTWVRLAQSALRKGKRAPDGRFELEVAAENNPGVFLATLFDAARQGLVPGTEQYYLTVRKVKGRPEILGITGYQGYIELMYRAGAVSSVIAEVVHGGDTFAYQPGRHEVPVHEIDWDAEDRGPLRLVYAYGRMTNSAVSRVIVLNRNNIERIKKSAQGADSEYSPWQTSEESMWLKSAVRQLRKWVPTSAEYRREILRATAEASRIAEAHSLPIPMSADDADDIIDGFLAEPDWPAVAEVANG